jgi:predicted peptidase
MRFVVLACVALLAGCAGNAGETLVRGTPPLDRSPAAAISADDFVAGSFTARDGTTLPYRLLTPAHIEPGRRYPLIVQFHGSGAIGSDNRAQVERDFAARAWAIPAIRARHPAFVLVPQFPVRSANYDDPMVPRSAVAAPALGAALELVDAVIARQPVDRRASTQAASRWADRPRGCRCWHGRTCSPRRCRSAASPPIAPWPIN